MALPAEGKYTIYALVDPRDGVARYVGVTGKSAVERLRGHMSSPSNPGVIRWVAELKALRLEAGVVALETIEGNRDQAHHVESKWILSGLDLDWPLVNRAWGCKGNLYV